MSSLSPKEHWDVVHISEEAHALRSARLGRTKAALKGFLGEDVLQRMASYDLYLLWQVIFQRHLPPLHGAKVVEVGSAPGEFLVEFSKRRNCIPYGIEYSDVGVQLNRQVFAANGFNPDNVIHTDFFSNAFRDRQREQFDVVISRGFIEHFDDPGSVIDRHVDLLKPGGHLIVSIPNLRGLNYPLARFLHKEVIPLHNLKIMRKEPFRRLFDRKDLQSSFCDYYGTFSFYLFTTGSSKAVRYAAKAGHKVQPLLNLAFRTFFGDKGAESRHLSPYLIYIGRKVAG